jgi:hypothetical protein
MTGSPTTNQTPHHYRSYLVRFWQSSAEGEWHASAQCVQTGKTELFGDVASLFSFLQDEIQLRSMEDGLCSGQGPTRQG